MKIGRTKSEVAHGTKLECCPQAVAFALIGINEGTIVLGQGEIGNQVPLLDIIGKTGQSFLLFAREKCTWHCWRSSMIKKGVGNQA